jgi:hypothetical protein
VGQLGSLIELVQGELDKLTRRKVTNHSTATAQHSAAQRGMAWRSIGSRA